MFAPCMNIEVFLGNKNKQKKKKKKKKKKNQKKRTWCFFFSFVLGDHVSGVGFYPELFSLVIWVCQKISSGTLNTLDEEGSS